MSTDITIAPRSNRRLRDTPQSRCLGGGDPHVVPDPRDWGVPRGRSVALWRDSEPMSTLTTVTNQDDIAVALERTVTDLINLGLVAKQAHWNIVGPSFRDLHLLLDEVADVARDGGDRVAERYVTRGGSPDGRPETVAMNNPLPSLDPGPLRDTDAVPLFGEILEIITTRLSASIGVAASDLVSQGILLRVTERLQSLAWMIRAHGAGGPR